MITEKLGLQKYNAAYSNLPLIFESDNINLPKFKYLINICYNPAIITAMVTYTSLTNVWTKATITAHKFNVGDVVLIFTGQYKGEYIVKEVLNINQIVIDLTLGIPFTMSPTTYICNFIPYKYSPDLEGQAKLDISNTIKDFVNSNLIDTNDIIDGSSTRFEFFIVAGEEYVYEFEFYDNAGFYGTGNNLSFYQPSITDINDVKFNIGDSINIQQDAYVWNYTDNFSDGFFVGFTGSTHSYKPGDNITITGQISHPEYNGPTRVVSVFPLINPTTLVVEKPWLGATPTEGGTIIGNIPPEYNTNANIVNIYIHSNPAIGLVIEVNIPYLRATAPISGIMKSITTLPTRDFNYVNESTSYVYDIRFDRLDYLQYGGYSNDIVQYNYVVMNSGTSKISTICNNGGFTNQNFINYNRIEFNTKSFLLVHIGSVTEQVGLKYEFYTNENALMNDVVYGTSYLYLEDDTRTDLYFPVGIKQLNNNINRIDVGGFNLEDDFINVEYYTVCAYYIDSGVEKTQKIYYKINKDCNRGLPTYHLMWKDAYGSWISYPFKYAAKESTNVDRSTYYKREGYFSNDTFNLPTIERGSDSFFVKSKNTIQLSSGWVKEYENKLFSDLIKSSEVYLQTPDITDTILNDGEFLVDEFGNFITDELGNKIIVGSDAYFDFITYAGYLLPVVLETKQIQYGTTKFERIFRYDPLVTYAFNDYRF